MKRKFLVGLLAIGLAATTAAGCSSATDEAAPATTVAPSTTQVEVSTPHTTVSPTEANSGEAAPPSADATDPIASLPVAIPDPCEGKFDSWSTLEDSTEHHLVQGTIDMVRFGHHDCFDRIVVDVDTTEQVGFHAKYVPVVLHEGSGFPVEVAGEATLQVVIDAPFAMTPNGMPAFDATPNLDVLREIRSAGSFEGQTTLAIGLSSKVKFGVYHLPKPDGTMRVVIDVVKPVD